MFPAVMLMLALAQVQPAWAESGKLIFTALVEHPAQGTPQVILEWGPLEGSIPREITSFKLYRAEGSGDYALLAELPFQLVSVEVLAQYINTDAAFRSESLVQDLDRYNSSKGGQTPITGSNAAAYLHDLLDPQQPDHDPLLTMLLTRAHLSAARGQGLAFIDTSVNTGSTYRYLLTAVSDNNMESKPVGQVNDVQPAVETVLPAPTGLRQVRLAACSALGGGRDDNLIHISWDVPSSPQDLGLKAVTYGYDLFWSENDEGTVDLRSGIPTQLHRVNQEPVVAAGPPPSEGPNSFLAKDGPANHNVGPAWKRGQRYWYYLAARDISGRYCAPVTPVQMEVVDAMPPHAVWNAHSQEIKDPADSEQPRLALVWDAPDPVNFARYYKDSRTFCSSTTDEICWVNQGESCTEDTPRCADLAVDHYLVFRFDDPLDPVTWGQDTDGDLWPDTLERDAGTDSCDPADFPSGTLPWHRTILPDDPQHIRTISDTHRQIFYIDTDVAPDNKVHWYRVTAVDRQGNQSPLSPPLRGVLYDRRQPKPDAYLRRLDCNYLALPDECRVDEYKDDLFIVQDLTGGDADSFALVQQCEGELGSFETLLTTGDFDVNGFGHVSWSGLPLDNSCQLTNCEGSSQFLIRYYDDQGNVLATDGPLSLENLCNFNGCRSLDKRCNWVITDTGMFPVFNGPLQICVNLEQNQSARVYYQADSGMSPFYSFDNAASSGIYCHQFDDLEGLTPADICLGVRTFSENHIGSRMLYLGCMELHAKNKEAPPAPVLNPVEPVVRNGDSFFDLHWSMPAAGIGSYIVRIQGPGENSFASLWDVQPDDMGLYPYSHAVTKPQDGDEWCFQVRALSTDMLAGPWSNTQCATWTSVPDKNLAWPPVAEPVVEGYLPAFLLKTDLEDQPTLVLSEDIGPLSRSFSGCSSLPTCSNKVEEACLRTEAFSYMNCPVCELIGQALPARAFIVYRQQSGHDFVQVTPLIETFHCTGYGVPGEYESTLNDPFIGFMRVDSSVILGVEEPIGVSGSLRVLLKDRYPFREGSRIRYKLVTIDPDTGEPVKVMTSNWLDTL
jgi:hypothetical protein